MKPNTSDEQLPAELASLSRAAAEAQRADPPSVVPLTPLDTSKDARIGALRERYRAGKLRVSEAELAAKIIDSHLKIKP